MTDYILVYDRILSDDEHSKIAQLMGCSATSRASSHQELAELIYSVFEFLNIITFHRGADLVKISSDIQPSLLLINPAIEPNIIIKSDDNLISILYDLNPVIESFWSLQSHVMNTNENVSSYVHSYSECFQNNPVIDEDEAFNDIEVSIDNEEARLKTDINSLLSQYRIK